VCSGNQARSKVKERASQCVPLRTQDRVWPETGLYEKSFPVGVRRFESCPLHQILKIKVERVNYIGPETLTNMDVIRFGSHDG
jgi:hypothetical protein